MFGDLFWLSNVFFFVVKNIVVGNQYSIDVIFIVQAIKNSIQSKYMKKKMLWWLNFYEMLKRAYNWILY